MENASKALYMVAGVLVGIIILGIFTYLFSAGGKMSQSYDKKQSLEQLKLFNSKFENFDKQNNTIIDMLTVTNLAIDINEVNEYEPLKSVEIDIMLSNTEKIRVSSTQKIERNYLLKGNSETETIYIYNLLNKNRQDLQSEYSLNISSSIMENEDTLSKVNDKMVYKYLFKCTDIRYHTSNGRVKYMKFELIKNTAYVP